MHLSHNLVRSVLGLAGLTLFAGSALQSHQQALAARGSCLTPEQEEILGHMSLVDVPNGQGGVSRTLRISGLNVQIVNGLGATNGYPANSNSVDPGQVAVNGLGNLILGYDEPSFGADKTGSHNLVIGPFNDYSSFGGIVSGRFNRLEGAVSVVLGGGSNYAQGVSSAVIGGHGNGAIGSLSLAAGGLGGEALTNQSTTMGGQFLRASGFNSSVLGGFRNEAAGPLSTVVGGAFNQGNGMTSSVSGGLERTADGEYDWVAGSLFEDR